VYLPVYILPLLVFKHKQLLSSPVTTLVKVTRQITQSSIFLGAYCTLSWAAVCFHRQYTGTLDPLVARYAGLWSGTAQLLERPTRRIELTLYILAQAFQSFWNRTSPKYIPKTRQALSTERCAVAVFVGSMMVIMHTFINKPYIMRSSYFSLLRFFFGSGGKGAGFPLKHSYGSTQDLSRSKDGRREAGTEAEVEEVGADTEEEEA
jgi:hypothetical protein